MSLRHATCLLLVLMLAVCGGGTATADDPPAAEPEPDQTNMLRAQDLYHQALQNFNAEQYREAAAALQEAYRLVPEPIFLFNLGQSYRRTNRLRESRQAFSRFLREDPQDRNGVRRLALTSIRELDFLIVQQDAARRPAWKKPWFWGLVAAGVAVAGAGLGLGLGLRDNTETADLRSSHAGP